MKSKVKGNGLPRVVNGEIVFDASKMEVGKYYPVKYKGERHVVRKGKDGNIDVYRLEPAE